MEAETAVPEAEAEVMEEVVAEEQEDATEELAAAAAEAEVVKVAASNSLLIFLYKRLADFYRRGERVLGIITN